MATVSDHLFSQSENVYNHELAIKSLKLAIAAFTSENTMQNWGETGHYGRENNVKDTLTEFGFGNLSFYNYDSSLNDSSSKVAFATGEKFYNSDTVIVAIAIRGGGYGLEWADNFNVGNSSLDYHKGFYDAALKVKNQVDQLILDYVKNYNVKIWVTGYSRGGAVANLVSAMINDESGFESCQLYSYTFASPKTTIYSQTSSHHKMYKNIFNILSPNDPVYNIPPSKWGFGRFGVCVVFPDNSGDNSLKTQKIRELVYDDYYLRTGKPLSYGNKLGTSLVNLIIKSAEDRDFFNEYLAKPLSDLIIIKMTKNKTSPGNWENTPYETVIKNMYGEDGINELNKVKDSYLFNSLKKMGVAVPEDFYIFITLCRMNGYSSYENLIFNSIDINELYNITSIQSGDFLYMGHSTDFYISWLTKCPKEDLNFVYE